MKYQNNQSNQSHQSHLSHENLNHDKLNHDKNLPALSELQKRELTKLVNKYENRKDYGQKTQNPRKTYVHIKEKNYPDYFHISDSNFRLEYNAAMEELEKMGLVQLVWKKFERGEFLDKIALEEKRLEDIYRLLNRQPKADYYRELESIFNKYRESALKVLTVFYDEMLEKIKRLENLPNQVRFDSLSDTEDFLFGLNNIVKNGLRSDLVEVPKRQFSIELYGESKRLEDFEKKILYVLQNYLQDYNQNYNPNNSHEYRRKYKQKYNLGTENLKDNSNDNSNIEKTQIKDTYTKDAYTKDTHLKEEDEITLAEFGIIDNPHPVNIRGQLEFETSKGMVDLNKFYPDVGLSPRMIQDMTITGLNATAIVTIENLTSYYIYIKSAPEEQLVIYLGGYHNKMRRNILSKIWQFQRNCQGQNLEFYHWGDIDYGGFRIFKHLKAKTGIPFKPLMMDENTYVKHYHKGHKFESNYERKLEKLLNDEDYIEFHPVIRLMLDKKIRLEQEGVTEIIYP